MDNERVVGGFGTEAQQAPERKRRNTPEVDAERLMNGAAWTEFCDTLKAAGDHILSKDAPTSPLDRAEGFRYLTGLVTAGIRQAVGLSDPDFPTFFRNPDSSSKWGAENADNQYLWARIRSDATYRITGKRGSAYEFLIEVKEGYMQLGDVRNFATLAASELEIEPDGSFQIILSAHEHPGNWIPLHRDAAYVLIRQYLYDWEHEEPAEFRIVRVGSEGTAPPPIEPVGMARTLDNAAEWIETTAAFWNEWVLALRQEYQRNRIAPARLYVGGADDIRYGNDIFRLAEDEAMIIETTPPKARYWAFQLVNLWFESLDYANRQASINGHQAHLDCDGLFRVVIAHQDPGVLNWLDSAGHLEGIIQYRWIWTETDPLPKARVVKFADLRQELPAETEFVSAAARREIIAQRQNHLARREPVS
jgi:hypothetical protein